MADSILLSTTGQAGFGTWCGPCYVRTPCLNWTICLVWYDNFQAVTVYHVTALLVTYHMYTA